MAEKFLTEADWKKFAKSADYKDAPLLKALAALDKAERSPPADQLKALDEVEKQAETLVKAHRGDKPLADYVDDLEKAAKKQRKQLENEAREAESEEEEEDASPALLTSKMLPLLRELRKGGARMPVLIALAGRDTAVLIMRRAISPARRKLLNEYLQVSGGVKYVAGEGLLEEKALTFVVQSAAAGLAKRIKAALLAQTGLRVGVRVRGDEGTVEDEHEADGEGEETENEGRESEASEPTADSNKTPDPDAVLYEQRLEALTPALQRAYAARSGDVSKMRAVAEFAREKAEAGKPAAALQALDALEKLLAATAESADPEGLEHWQKVRTDVIAELKDIAKQIATAKHSDSGAALLELNAVIRQLTARPTTLQQIAELERYLGQDDVVDEVCEFAFDLRSPLLDAIAPLKATLEATTT